MTGGQADLVEEHPWGRRGSAGAAIAASLAFDDVSHSYGGHLAVDRVSLDVRPREVVALLGQSGCGKSTLLRVAAGLERQSAGRVLIDGKAVAGPEVFLPPDKRGVGLVFQDYALFPHLSILANVTFGLRALPAAEARRVAVAALERVGLAEHVDDFPHALSGGEQQRAALARAIAPRPGILLMDEPFSGLDRRLRDSVREETLAVLRETRATSILVTHDPEEAMRMADRIALMREGRIVELGTPEELYVRPRSLFAARFFSDLSVFEGVAREGAVLTPLGPVAAPGLPHAAAVQVAVRTQGFRIAAEGSGAAGRVISRCFAGEVDILEVAVAGVEAPLRVRSREIGRWAAGRDVVVTIDPSDALVFPAART